MFVRAYLHLCTSPFPPLPLSLAHFSPSPAHACVLTRVHFVGIRVTCAPDYRLRQIQDDCTLVLISLLLSRSLSLVVFSQTSPSLPRATSRSSRDSPSSTAEDRSTEVKRNCQVPVFFYRQGCPRAYVPRRVKSSRQTRSSFRAFELDHFVAANVIFDRT